MDTLKKIRIFALWLFLSFIFHTFLTLLVLVAIYGLPVVVYILGAILFSSYVFSTANSQSPYQFLMYLIRYLLDSEESVADLSALRVQLIDKGTKPSRIKIIMAKATISMLFGLAQIKLQNILWRSRNRTRD